MVRRRSITNIFYNEWNIVNTNCNTDIAFFQECPNCMVTMENIFFFSKTVFLIEITYLAYLTSLKEITVKHELGEQPNKIVKIDIEPTFISLSNDTIGVC